MARPMRILIPGGSGQVGTLLARHLTAAGHTVTVLSRSPQSATQPAPWRTLPWDGLTEGPWVSELHTTDAVIHLSGRSINCRHTPANRRQILDSRVLPTLLLGRLIAASPTPPPIWLNASAATYYPNPTNVPQDETTPAQPDTSFSNSVTQQWEAALEAIPTPHTRRIRLRTSLMMSPDPGGVFSVLSRLARFGLGGTLGSGRQYVSWIHGLDYCRIVDHLLAHPETADPTHGIVNMTAPDPLPNRDFNRILRQAWHQPIGLPAYAWMVAIGGFLLRTEPDLILANRRCVPNLLLNQGFQFTYPTWTSAATDLVKQMQYPTPLTTNH